MPEPIKLKLKLKLLEVFSSVQGEGVLLGCRQIFVRLAGCNLRCRYCDTASSQGAANHCAKIEATPGRLDFRQAPPEVTVDFLAEEINKLLHWPHHSVSLTGGEPLCQARALKLLAPLINAPLYLETNGTLPEALEMIIDDLSYISMDFKLPSANARGENYWREHALFLEKALRQKKKIFIKIVITGDTQLTEIEKAVEIIASLEKKTPLILQPATPLGSLRPVSFHLVSPFFEYALEKLPEVRVIPQMHKFMGII